MKAKPVIMKDRPAPLNFIIVTFVHQKRRRYFTIVPVRLHRVFLKKSTMGFPSCDALSS